ncbi:protein eyes shut homolog, partial [Magallana gigas]|uniref:protein eyes shut homolog n=1 Tax=Magallana gigas TaxID=29159 RepID=UPI00333F5D98
MNTVCFMICSKGESRCFQINTNDLVDRCASKPCLNDSYCHTKSSGNFQCHCRDGFWGTRCENGFCSRQYCDNNAVCFTRNGDHNCLCRLGFVGTTCSKEINQNLTDSTENGGHFKPMSLITNLTCFISSPCFVPISIARNVHSIPVVDIGFSDKTLEVQSLDLESESPARGIVRGTLTVIGHELGSKLICLDSVANPKTAKIEDEICFRISVIQGHILEPIETKPYFIKPTLPDSTVLQCVVNKQCYLSLWAKNKVGVEKCPQLEVDKTIEDGVYIFPLQDTTHQPCVYDSVLFIDHVTDLEICFSLPFEASSERDKRCYTVLVRQKFTAKGYCAGMSCYNDGFCDGSSPSSQCLCRSGFSNYNCSHDVGVAQGNNSYSNLQPRFGDLALPKLIRCPLSENCVIPFSVTQTNNFTSVNVRWNGTNINFVNVSLSQIPGSRDLSGSAVVVHNATGNDEFCLALVIGDNVYDRVCCLILTDSAAVHQQLDNGQGLFISPSPTNNSEFSCTPGQPCHVTFKTRKGDDHN